MRLNVKTEGKEANLNKRPCREYIGPVPHSCLSVYRNEKKSDKNTGDFSQNEEKWQG